MKAAILGLAVAALMLASAFAHALLGWPAMRAPLVEASVDPGVVGALAVGWSFGSVCMLAFAFLVGRQALRCWKGARVDVASLSCVAAAYILFGTAAFVLRDFNPHFLFFVATGLLVAAFAVLSVRGSTVDQGAEPDR